MRAAAGQTYYPSFPTLKNNSRFFRLLVSLVSFLEDDKTQSTPTLDHTNLQSPGGASVRVRTTAPNGTHLSPSFGNLAVMVIILRLDRCLGVCDAPEVPSTHNGHCKPQYNGENIHQKERDLRRPVWPWLL